MQVALQQTDVSAAARLLGVPTMSVTGFMVPERKTGLSPGKPVPGSEKLVLHPAAI